MNVLQFFINLDGKILDRLESWCHKQQRVTGKTHYFWLRPDALITAALCWHFPYQSSAGLDQIAFSLIIVAFVFLGLWGFPWWEERSYRRISKGLANPLRKPGQPMLIRYALYYSMVSLSLILCGHSIYALVAIPSTQLIIKIGFGLLVLLTWYACCLVLILPACDPLPPAPGKIQQWLEKRRRQGTPTHATA